MFTSAEKKTASDCVPTLKGSCSLEIYFCSHSFMFFDHKCEDLSPDPQQGCCLCVWIPKTHLPVSKIASGKKPLEKLAMRADIKFDSE